MEEFIVRKYKDGDEEEINRLFNDIFGEKRSIDEWAWKFRKNPFGDILLIGLAESGGQIVGQYANIPILFKYKDSNVLVGLPVDNFVHPNFRGGFKGMQKAMFEFQNLLADENNICFGLGFPNREAYIVGKRVLKYKDIGRIPVLFRRLNWRLAIKRILPSLPSIVLNTVRDINNVVYRILIKTKSRHKPEGLKIKLYDSFDERFDEFWEKIKGQYGIIGVRDQKFLNWRYKKPGNTYEIIVAELAGKIAGYAVIKTKTENEHVVAYIIDILVDESLEAGPAIIKLALLRVLSNKADYVFCWMMQDKMLYQSLKNFGFIERDIDQPINGVHLIFDRKNIDESYIGNPKNWYLTMGDSDTL